MEYFQCDQVAGLFVKLLGIYKTEKLPKSI